MAQDRKTEEATGDQPEIEAVISWRFLQLQRAGADVQSAQIISHRTDISLHDAIELLEHGCSSGLMVLILV